jgi:subtilisin family serine protease
MIMRVCALVLIILISVQAIARDWKFEAFRGGKVQLAKVDPAAEASAPGGLFSKSQKSYDLILLVNNDCLAGRSPFKALGFDVQHKNSGVLSVEALNARYSGNLNPVELEKRLASEPCIAGLTRNPEVFSQAVNDPLLNEQPSLFNIGQLPGEKFFFHPLWGIRREVNLAVVDSGAQLNHPDLVSRIWRSQKGTAGYDFVNDDDDPSDDFGHGTHVAGIALAQRDNGVGIRGVMGDWSKLMVVKSQNSQGSGTMADVINSLRWAVDNGAEVVNLSLASRQQNQALVDALNYAVAKGVTVVVAAGNNGEQITTSNFITPIGYATGLPGVIGVGSIDTDSGLRSNFSNYSSNFVEIGAPGSTGNTTGILSTFPDGRYFGVSGTSMSAPHVAGAAALVTGFLKTHSVNFNPDQVEQMILVSARTTSANSSYFWGGRALDLESLGRLIFNSTYVNSTGGFDD